MLPHPPLFPLGKNFWVGVEGGRGVSTGVLRVAVLLVAPTPRPGLGYSSATMTTSLPPIAEERFRISSFSSYTGGKL